MATPEKEDQKNLTPLSNQENIKEEDITSQTKNQNDNNTKNESKNQNVILPLIKRPKITLKPVGSFNRKLKSSQSQEYIFNSPSNKTNRNSNTEKEKLIIAKLNLARLITKINDINFSYKKLLAEKEENLKILRQAISSNDYTYSENLYKKINKMLEDALSIKENSYKTNYESSQRSMEENNNNQINEKKEDIPNQSNDKQDNDIIENKIEEKIENNENGNLNNEANNDNNNNNINADINNENVNNENNNNENNNNDNINNENNNNENINNENNINIVNNEELKNRHNYSMETRGEDLNNFKNNSFNNSRIINNSNISNNNINNSIEEEKDNNSIKEVNEELNKYQIENGLFEKSVISSKFYNILKAKTELSTLKHKMIKLKENINLKEEEINEIKNRAKMKNIIFQSNLLGKNMSELHKLKTKNKEIEDISIPNKHLQYENLKKELEYYKNINKNALAESKTANENYVSVKNEFDEKSKLCSELEGKNTNLKYKLNTLKQNDLKKTITLKIMNQKIGQIAGIREMIEEQKKMISEKEKEINELKENLNKKISEYEASAENRNKGFDEMNTCEREFNSKISKQKNEFNKIRNEIRDIDKLISKEIDIYSDLNKENQDSVHQMYYKKSRNIKEFMEFLKEEEIIQEKKDEEYKKECHKKYSIGNKFAYTAICKYTKKKDKKKDKNKNENKNDNNQKEEEDSNKTLLLLNEKLEY